MNRQTIERIIGQHKFTRTSDPILKSTDSSPLVALYVNQRPRRNPSLIYLIRPETLADWLLRFNGTPNLWLHRTNGPMAVYQYHGQKRSLLFAKYLVDAYAAPLSLDQVAKPVAWDEPKVDYFKTLWLRDKIGPNGKPLGNMGQAAVYNEQRDRFNAALLDLRPEVWRAAPTQKFGGSRSIKEQLKEYKSVQLPCTQRALEAALVPPDKIVDQKCWAAYQ